MEDVNSIQLVGQFLHERGFKLTLEALQEESGRTYDPEETKEAGKLQSILDDYYRRMKQQQSLEVSVDHLLLPWRGLLGSQSYDSKRAFGHGQGEHANTLLKSLDDVSGGVNILVVRLIENGAVVFGASKSLFGIGELVLPFSVDKPPISPIFTIHTFCSGGVLALDVHPVKRNLILCGSMDRQSFILDCSQCEVKVVQRFEKHKKYVVRVMWSPSGKFFVTASYDKTICIYRVQDDDSELYDNVQMLLFTGVIESLAFSKGEDIFVVGVRNDYLLHCYNLTSGTAELCREINLNALGDDYVSFVPMHMSFSPDGQFILISTDRDTLILYSWRTGKQVASFYGATNDEFSQPRHCWDYSGKYIYGTSQDKSIVVWEIRSQNIVTKLVGHTATVRDLHFCCELKMLVSCGFDGSIKLWTNVCA